MITLIAELKNENADYLDPELLNVAENSKNKKIVSGIMQFFGEREKSGIEDRAHKAIEARDDEADETVLAAIDYLGQVAAQNAQETLTALLAAEERKFMTPAIRALGKIGGGLSPKDEAKNAKRAASAKGDEIAEYLMAYYADSNADDAARSEILAALGNCRSSRSTAFLAEIAENND